MGILKEFRDFAIRGNVIDMAVGIIIGGAFGTIVTSLVNDVLKPPLDYVVARGQPDPAGLKAKVGDVIVGEGADMKVTSFFIDYGKFINAIISFLIVAFAVFLLVKAINTARRYAEKEKAAEAPPEAPPDLKLLAEIRDLLAARK